MNIDKENNNAIDQNNDLNQSKLRNKINDNILNLNITYNNNNNHNDNNNNENIKNSNNKSDIINDRVNNDAMDLNNNNNNNNDKIVESETDQIVKEEVTTYKRNDFIPHNNIKVTDTNELMTSKDLLAEQGNKDNYKNKNNSKKNIALDVAENNSESRFNKNENKNKNEKKNYQLSISYKVLLTIIYILFGHCFIFSNNFLEIIKKDYYKLPFLFIIIPYFFIQILINILLFFPYLFKGFDSFLSEFCYIIKFKYNNMEHFLSITNFSYYSAEILFLGTFLFLIKLISKLLHKKN
jgi:cation transport ATPase